MKQLTINSNNRQYYSEDFIKGFECGTQRQFEADKADIPTWIPCSERLPRPYTEVLVCDECGWISMGSYRPCDVTEKDSGWSTLTRIKIPTVGIIAWMPLPKPWKGAEDEATD